MTTEQIAEKFNGRAAGQGRWKAKCPSHNGRTSTSLSIASGENGRTLLKCWSGCAIEDICTALGIKIADLFSKPGTSQPKPREVARAEKQIQNLRSRLTKREQVLPVTIVYCDRDNLDAGIARALALTVEEELAQAVLEPTQ